MQSFLRPTRFPARILRLNLLVSSTPRRYASESYGGSQTGHKEANKDSPNPKADQEHPGPKAPVDKGTAQSGQSQGSGAQSESGYSSGGRPAIYQPGPPPENKDAEVQAHNREMENRNDKTVNQLYEEDNKVDKNFWSVKLKSSLTNFVMSEQETLDQRLEKNRISDKDASRLSDKSGYSF